MTRKTMRQTDEFTASDKNGNAYQIAEFTDFIAVPGHPEVEGLKSFFLPNGDPVNMIDEQTFRTVLDEVELKRD